jgi:peptide subunit release factor 1 (eRF1)
MAVAPPFPVDEDAVAEGFDTGPLVELLTIDRTVGVVLLRLGRYAVGIVRGEKLLASKSGSRYVKNRHRKGGSSQHRFERSRERLIRELFDKTCQTARDVFEPREARLDYLLLGGERHTVADFEKRCGYLRRSGVEVLRRRLEVDRPGKVALEKIHREVWKSRIYEFSRGDAELQGEDRHAFSDSAGSISHHGDWHLDRCSARII